MFLHFLYIQSIILYDFDVISKIKFSITVSCYVCCENVMFCTFLGSKTTFLVKIDILGKKSVFLLFLHNQSIILYDFGVNVKIMFSLTV